MTWTVETLPDETRTGEVTDRLVEYNTAASEIVRERFQPEHLKSNPVAAYAIAPDGTLLGGCVGRTEDLWHWLHVDLMWVDPTLRGSGLGRTLLTHVEDQARARGCRWSKLSTWDFQAPGFYAANGYDLYATEPDYPPGHTSHLMRKEL